MYKIIDVNIENNVLVSRVVLIMPDKEELEVLIPVKLAKTKEDVFRACEVRYVLERDKYVAAPELKAVKAEIEAGFLGKVTPVL